MLHIKFKNPAAFGGGQMSFEDTIDGTMISYKYSISRVLFIEHVNVFYPVNAYHHMAPSSTAQYSLPLSGTAQLKELNIYYFLSARIHRKDVLVLNYCVQGHENLLKRNKQFTKKEILILKQEVAYFRLRYTLTYCKITSVIIRASFLL